MKKVLLSAATMAMVAMGAHAHAAVQTVDFEDESAGDVITTQFAPTLTISATRKDGTTPRDAMIFNTESFTGGDDDLAAPIEDISGNEKDFGNVLIISEDGDTLDPDDDARGGIFHLTFDVPVTLFTLDALDINDDEGIEVTLFDENDLQIGLPIVNTFTVADNEFLTLDFMGVTNVKKIKIMLESSGAIDNLAFEPVPVPAALPLMGTGIAALMWARRRRRKTA